MAQTVIGLFDNTADAERAAQELYNAGIAQNSVDVSSAANTATANASGASNESTGDSISNFFGSLFEGDDATNYSEVARHTNTIVTVHAATTEQASTANEILDRNNAIDVDERAMQYRGAVDTNRTANVEGDVAIPIVEETLQVGKRTIETGGARIRSRVIEKPVEETLRLRSERVVVERRPVDRAATEADFNNFREGSIEVTEHAEVPVVSKEARVVEEIGIGKEIGERTETVRDTVRRTDVEVEEIDGDVDTRTNTARQ